MNNKGAGDGGRLVTLIAVTPPPASPTPPAEGIASWRTVPGLKEKQMSLCKDDFL